MYKKNEKNTHTLTYGFISRAHIHTHRYAHTYTHTHTVREREGDFRWEEEGLRDSAQNVNLKRLYSGKIPVVFKTARYSDLSCFLTEKNPQKYFMNIYITCIF